LVIPSRRKKIAPLTTAPSAEMGAEDRHRGGVQSIGRAFAILEQVARCRDGISLAELSKSVGLHNSTTFHLVQTMVALGYIRQVRENKRYRIGRPLFALAASALDEIEMVSLATPILEALSQSTGECGHFAVRVGDAAVVLARTSGPGAFQLADRVGVSRPLHCTALGKVLLAAVSPEQFEHLVARLALTPHTPKSITNAEALRRELEDVRQSGYALDDGEFDPEVRCVALPVREFTGRVVGALGISGPIWRLSIQSLRARLGIIQAAAAKLSAEFGAGGIPAHRDPPVRQAPASLQP
jgi:IclR family transcriptional regulator, KDG regulon repressor